MLKKSLFTLLIIITLLSQGCFEDKNVEEANSVITTNEYVLTSTDNSQLIIKKENNGFVLEGAKGKVIILDVFATWCPPCRAAAAHLSKLKEKYAEDLVIIGITIEDGIENSKLEDFKAQYEANYTLVNSSENRRLINEIALTLRVGERFPIPLMAIYKDGVLINHYLGAVEEEFINSDIKNALAK